MKSQKDKINKQISGDILIKWDIHWKNASNYKSNNIIQEKVNKNI